MKETLYRCNKCHQPLTDTRHKIAALNEAGKMTKYGALLEDIDLCENCMASVSLSILDIVGDQGRETEPGDDSEESKQGQQLPEDKKTYQCSKVIKTCKYAEKVGAAWCCNYIVVAKHRRGCEPEQCDKYERVIRKRARKPKTPEGEC